MICSCVVSQGGWSGENNLDADALRVLHMTTIMAFEMSIEAVTIQRSGTDSL